jgi:hypothetical protein
MSTSAVEEYIQTFQETLIMKISYFNMLKTTNEKIEALTDIHIFVIKNLKELKRFTELTSFAAFSETVSRKLKEFRDKNNILVDPKFNLLL